MTAVRRCLALPHRPVVRSTAVPVVLLERLRRGIAWLRVAQVHCRSTVGVPVHCCLPSFHCCMPGRLCSLSLWSQLSLQIFEDDSRLLQQVVVAVSASARITYVALCANTAKRHCVRQQHVVKRETFAEAFGMSTGTSAGCVQQQSTVLWCQLKYTRCLRQCGPQYRAQP